MKVRKQTKGRHAQVYIWYSYVAKRLIRLRPVERACYEDALRGDYWIESPELGVMYGADYERLTGKHSSFIEEYENEHPECRSYTR